MRRILFLLAVPLLAFSVPAAPRAGGEAQVLTIPLPTSGMLYDPVSRKLYATVGAEAPQEHANSIVTLDPATGRIERSVFVGSGPGPMVLSAESRYLYVAVGGRMIRRYEIATGEAGPQFPLGDGLAVTALAPAPRDPEAVVVARHRPGISPGDEGVALYVNGEARPGTVRAGNQLAVGIVPELLYGYQSRSSSFELTALRVAPDGIHERWRKPRVITGAVGVFSSNGILFNTSGAVVDPELRHELGHLAGTGPNAVLLPDPERGFVYQLADGKLAIYDLERFTRVTELGLGVGGQARHPQIWGDQGLAFATEREVISVRVDLGARRPPVDLSVSRSDLPRTLRPGAPFTYRLTVRNESGAPSTGAFLTDALPRGAEVREVRASQGDARAADGVVRAELGALPARGQATVEVTLDLRELRGLDFAAVVRGREPDPRPDNNLDVVDMRTPLTDLPDLAGEWRSLEQTVSGAGVNLQAVLRGVLTVGNIGNRPAPASRTRFFLADTPRFDPRWAVLLQEVQTPALAPGQTVNLRLEAPLGRGTEALGLYVIAVLDAAEAVEEANRENNILPRQVR